MIKLIQETHPRFRSIFYQVIFLGHHPYSDLHLSWLNGFKSEGNFCKGWTNSVCELIPDRILRCHKSVIVIQPRTYHAGVSAKRASQYGGSGLPIDWMAVGVGDNDIASGAIAQDLIPICSPLPPMGCHIGANEAIELIFQVLEGCACGGDGW